MLDFSNGLDGFLHSLIPDRLRDNAGRNDAEYIRMRSLAGMLTFLTALLAFMLVPLWIWHLLLSPDNLRYDMLSVFVFLAVLLQLYLFHRFQNYWLSALAFTSMYFLMVVVIVMFSAGHHSTMKVLLLTCPVLSFIIGGKHEGIQNSILVMLIGAILALLDYIDFETPTWFSGGNPHLNFSIDWIFAVLTMTFCLLVYDVTLSSRESSRLSRARARAILLIQGFVVIAGAISIFPWLLAFWLTRENPADTLRENMLIVVIWMFFAAQFGLFYRFRNLALSGLIFANSYFVAVVAMVLLSGGYDSPILYFLMSCPCIAFLCGGVKEGIQSGVLVALSGVCLAWLHAGGFVFTDTFTAGENLHVVFSANWAMTVGIVAMCLGIYDNELQRQE